MEVQTTTLAYQQLQLIITTIIITIFILMIKQIKVQMLIMSKTYLNIYNYANISNKKGYVRKFVISRSTVNFKNWKHIY